MADAKRGVMFQGEEGEGEASLAPSIASLQAKNAELQKTNAELQRKGEEHHKKIMELKREAWRSNDKKKAKAIIEMEAEIEKSRETANNLQYQVFDLNQKILDLHEDIHLSKNQNKMSLQLEHESLLKQLEIQKKVDNVLKGMRKDLETDIKMLQELNEELDKRHKAELDSLESENERLHQKILELNNDLQDKKFKHYHENVEVTMRNENTVLRQELQEIQEITDLRSRKNDSEDGETEG